MKNDCAIKNITLSLHKQINNDMDEFLLIDTKESCAGLICFLTLNSRMNAIACTEPLRFVKQMDFIENVKNPLGSYTKRDLTDFKPIHVDKINQCVEDIFISGTLNTNKSVIKNTPENREILGIKTLK